jgi:ATP diphosphatase
MDNLLRLLNIMQVLRDPEQGCAWDIKQTFSSIVPYTIEEVYEVADAIDQQDFEHLKDELGDLLLQIVYYAQMAREQNLFDFEAVAGGICDKLVRRHPHIFDEQNFDGDKECADKTWEQVKHLERNEKAGTDTTSLLNDIPLALPQLIRAKKIQKRVASVGFDWPEISGVIEKVEEELAELKEVIHTDNNYEALEEELGDLLFSIVNLGRHLDVNAEEALRKGNKKFIKRFQYLEEKIKCEDGDIQKYSLSELEECWQQAKQATRS